MNRELRFAQHNLTEYVIRRFWKALTLTFPSMCVNDGISIDYREHYLTANKMEHIVQKLTQCKSSHVACPFFQFDYDPSNSTPHHVTAVTLTKTDKYNVLSFFDPKGKGSCRKKEEYALMKILVEKITEKTGIPTKLYIYNGKNLQQDDNIGLCQLYSLFYLYEFVNEVSAMSPKSIHTIVDPNRMVNHIAQKRGSFNDKTLFAFWNAFFRIALNLSSKR